MKITVNGEAQTIENQTTISELLSINKVQNAEMVSVQVNGDFVDRESFTTSKINENDEIDFLYFMGGGSL